ncbi:MAG: hypothetical protein HC896_08695 [Bacteroidales bacterium]|nr:hypothetical protein [Bacteroidales bacterium]
MLEKPIKKVLVFNNRLEIVYQKEHVFATTLDEDGFECDDLGLIEDWVLLSIKELIVDFHFNIVAVNFTTYGASMLFLDKHGHCLTPLYNYLKPVPASVEDKLFYNYGGKEEFCRKTASPALGLLLNAGIQILWLKEMQPKLYGKVKHMLHFPQYLSYLYTKRFVSEPTSIGCHTFYGTLTS